MMPRRHKITAMKFTDRTVSFRLDGEPVWDRVEISPRVPMVGHFNLNRPVVRVDAKITNPKEQQAIALHEAIERHERRGGLAPHQAHVVAEATEARWDARHGVPMRSYSRHVEQVFRENAREGVRRRR